MSEYTTTFEPIKAYRFKTISELKAFLKKTEYKVEETSIINIAHPQRGRQVYVFEDYVAIFGDMIKVIPPDSFEKYYTAIP